MPVTHLICPRCQAPTRTAAIVSPTSPDAVECVRCTWPSPSFTRMEATLARRGQDGRGFDMTDEGLEEFVTNLPPTFPLRDPRGRIVMAKVFRAHIHDGQVDVTFEFDPDAWSTVH